MVLFRVISIFPLGEVSPLAKCGSFSFNYYASRLQLKPFQDFLATAVQEDTLFPGTKKQNRRSSEVGPSSVDADVGRHLKMMLVVAAADEGDKWSTTPEIGHHSWFGG